MASPTWDLAWDWEFNNSPSDQVIQWGKMREIYLAKDIDWSKPIAGDQLQRRFDYYFGDGTINFPPYASIENEQVIEAPTKEMNIDSVGLDTKEGSWVFRPRPKVKKWNPYEVLPTLTKKIVVWIS